MITIMIAIAIAITIMITINSLKLFTKTINDITYDTKLFYNNNDIKIIVKKIQNVTIQKLPK